MKSHCLRCGGVLRKTRAPHRYAESGLTFIILVHCLFLKCTESNCNDEMAVLPNAASVGLAIAERLIKVPTRLGSEAIRFLRRMMGLNADEFAVLLGTTRVEVSRWENGKTRISGITDFRLRREVVDKLLPASDDRYLLLEDIALAVTKDYRPTTKQEDILIDATGHYGSYGTLVQNETVLTASK